MERGLGGFHCAENIVFLYKKNAGGRINHSEAVVLSKNLTEILSVHGLAWPSVIPRRTDCRAVRTLRVQSGRKMVLGARPAYGSYQRSPIAAVRCFGCKTSKYRAKED